MQLFCEGKKMNLKKTNFGIVASKEDKAGMNIAAFLEGNLPKNMKLHFIEGNQCFADSVNEIDADFFIFASLHKSKSEKPTLTVHSIGNWDKAEYGGKDNTLVPTNSFLIKNYLCALQKEERPVQYDISLEANHHGPFLTKPTVFIELGSSEKQWQDREAAKAIANVILSSTSLEGNFKSAIALGGGHYCREFTKIVLRTEWALGCICPQYALPSFNEKMLQKAIKATYPKPEAIIIDWKGLGKEKARIKELLEEQELPILRARKVLG